MLKMTAQVENIVNAYKTLAKIPSIVSGKITRTGKLDNYIGISSKWSVRNLDRGKTSKYTFSYVLNDKLEVISESDFGTDVGSELLTALSPKETFKAVVREEKDSKDVKKQYLEVWRRNHLEHSIDLTALDIHGDVYADSEFASLDWTQDESAIVYVAEKKLAKSEPYVKRKGEEKEKSEGSGDKPIVKGEEYVYKQDWGEQLVGKHLSVIVVCRLKDERFTVLEGLPDSWCPGQVKFSLDGTSVYGVAWETEPRRLGLIFCTNRPSFIFNLTLDGKFSKLSSEGMSVRSPRIGPAGGLCWLQRSEGGPHHACHSLVTTVVNESKSIIPIIETEINITNGIFHGIYSQALPANCYAFKGRYILFSTPQQNEVRSYIVDIENGNIRDISNKQFIGSTSILDVKNDIILAVCSSMNTPGELYAARLCPDSNLDWKRVSQNAELPEIVKNSKFEYLQLTHEDSEDSVKTFSAIYFAPEKESKLPLIVWPHGGPHSNFVNAYSLEAALFSMLGFASLQINYRGSTGTGEKTVQFLPKRAGVADVNDCKYATDVALKKYNIDDKKLCLFGGSHGGFLVTHLSGQYPEFFKVVVSRNPVTDVASMFSITDITDWCAVEAGFEFTEKGAVSEEQLIEMRRCSPMAHVHKVKAPTALMLGAVDKRVPFYQGLEYARRLKANGVETRVYMYDDNHSLSTPPAEMDNLINSAKWFLEHL